MELRTIAILLLMATIVVLTAAFGTYQDGIDKQKDHEFQIKRKEERAAEGEGNGNGNGKGAGSDLRNVVGASGAATSYKQSAGHLDTSQKVNRPYVPEGTNTYRGKAGGYDLRDTYNDGDSDDDGGNGGSDSDDAAADDGKPMSDFQRKIKYIKTIFKEIFSKWGSQETIMAPISVEEDPDNPLGEEGFRIREKFKRTAKAGMRKLKSAFRGNRRSGK
jgi:hypothetical protein